MRDKIKKLSKSEIADFIISKRTFKSDLVMNMANLKIGESLLVERIKFKGAAASTVVPYLSTQLTMSFQTKTFGDKVYIIRIS